MAGPDRAVVVEKLMSLTRAEFSQGLAVFLERTVAPDERFVCDPLGAGSVEIRYEPLPGVRLGGLLELPRATVRLAFRAVGDTEREAYLRRFDLAFQRGGG